MILKRFYDDKLAQASYLIGCAATGEAIVVDPNRDAEQYLRAAEAEGVRIAAVTETHIHADFLSGTRELASRAEARMLLSSEGGPDWQYAFAAPDGARLLADGDVIRVGNVELRVMHTPGHTPEHLSFVVTDTAGATGPMGILTGDFVFVGDVGRPDLLEKAVRVDGSAAAAARTLFRSLQRFHELDDHLQVWPGHGAGSACGKGMSAVPQSTVGYERRFNWALGATDEAAFVAQVLADQPEPPTYFAEMKRLNRDGPPVLGGLSRPPRVEPERLRRVLAEGGLVVDTRPSAAFTAGHVPGTISIPLGRSFTTWAGWLLPYDRPCHLIVPGDSLRALDEVLRDLAMIGLDSVAGYFDAAAVDAWDGDLEALSHLDVAELAARLASPKPPVVIDVRGLAEWKAGHLPGVPNIPLGYLTERLADVPRDRPVVLHCQGGTRSQIGVSLLQARGYREVHNLAGGFAEWQRAGQPVDGEEVAAQTT